MATTIASPTPVAVDIYQGASGETIRMVELSIAMIAMPGFQRDRKAAQIAKIAAKRDETAYAFPICATFKSVILGIDGQQRLAAWEADGLETATVLLIEGITSEARLAHVYLLINRDRKFLDALEKYIGALASKDPGTIELEKIVTVAGFEIAKSAAANGKVPAGAVTTIYEHSGAKVLERTLNVRARAWGHEGSREANEGQTLKGIAQFVRRYYDKIDDDQLVIVLQKHHPNFILQAVDRRRGTSRTLTYSDFLREQYNRSRRGKGGRL